MSAARVLRRAATLVPTPWKNGGGTTSEIAIDPPQAGFDDFVWRTSVATIARDGAFSDFPGIDRTLVLLSGAGMDVALTPQGGESTRHTLHVPYVPFPFSGDTALHAWLKDGPTADFNLMVRRDKAEGELTVWGTDSAGKASSEASSAWLTHSVPDDAVLLFLAAGTAQLHDMSMPDAEPVRLSPHDSVQLAGGAAQTLSVTRSEDAVMLVVRVRARAQLS